MLNSTTADKAKGLTSLLWERLRSIDSKVWLVGALLVATAMRLPGLGQQSLWWDEGITYTLIRPQARMSGVLQNILMTRDAAPLYYLLLRGWIAIFGTSEFALRAPSAFFAIVNVAVISLLGQLNGRESTGVWAAWFLAVNPFHVWYSREVRPYAMAFLLVACAMRYFFLGLRCREWRHWLAVAVTGGLSYLTHYVSGAIGVIQLSIFLTSLRKTYRSLRKWVVVQALSVAPALSWLVLSVLLYGYSGLRRPGIPKPSLLAPLKTLWNFSLGHSGQFTVFTALGLLPFGALVAWKGLKAESLWQTLILTWLALPLSLAFILSFLMEPVYMDRYLGICVVAYVLWLASSLSLLSRDVVQTVAGLALLIAMLGSSVGIITGQRLERPDWRGAVSRVIEEAEESDRLFVGAGIHAAYYYAADCSVPIEYVDGKATGSALTQVLGLAPRVWFLYRDPRVTSSGHVLIQAKRFDPYESGSPEIAEWLSDHRDWISQEWFLDGLYLALLESGGRSSSAVAPTLPQ